MRKFIGSALVSSVMVVSGAAMAADIPMKAPVARVAMAPAWGWDGFYLGAHAGYAWGRTRVTDRDGYNTVVGDTWDFRTSGFVGGGQLGYNVWMNPLLFGIEADLGYLGLRGNGQAPAGCRFFACDSVGSVQSDFYATLRGRLGITAGDVLFYITGGGIGINQRTSVVDTCFTAPCGFATLNAADSSFRFGWTGGGGIEWHIPGTQWTVKGEYLYFDVGNKQLSGVNFFPPSTVPGFTWRWPTSSIGHIARVGVNYHF